MLINLDLWYVINMGYMENLNKEQKIAVTAEDKHILVLAGAGTGKTRTIVARAAYLLEKGVRADRIIILSFTRKSAREIAERVKGEISIKEKSSITGQTFHSWCFELIKSNPGVFRESSYSLIDEDDADSIFRYTFPRKAAVGLPVRAKDIKDVYSYMVNTGKSLSEAIKTKLSRTYPSIQLEDYISSYASYYQKSIKAYVQYKAEHRYLDYDDLLYVVSTTLKKNPKARDYIARQYDHILVDEMQDTNPLQYELLSSFYDSSHIFAVGDDAQSIYAFRGADFRSIHSFASIVPDAKVYKLRTNYRSFGEILDVSNWLLAESPLNYDKKLIAFKGRSGQLPKLVHTDNGYEEANYIVDRIADSISDQTRDFNDFLVLSRTVMGLRKTESICIARDIPYRLYGGSSLLESKHIRDVISPIRVILNVHDEIAWMRFLTLFRGVGEKSALKLIEMVRSVDDSDSAIKVLKDCKAPSSVISTLDAINRAKDDAKKAVKAAYKYLEKRLNELYKDEWDYRKKDFEVLFSLADKAKGLERFISDFVLSPRLEETFRTAESTDSYVILSTIHSAKGLERDVCFILDVSPYSFPTERAYADGTDAIEEERRCLYVALTRAKDELYIMRNARSIHAYEAKGSDCPYFLNGFDLDLVELESPSDGSSCSRDSFTGRYTEFSIMDDLDFT